MVEATARHIVDEHLSEPASYLTIRRGDRVYDLYGWPAGRVVELRVVASRDEFFDGVVVDFRGRRLFVDAPEVTGIYEGVVVVGLTVADMTRAVRDKTGPPRRAAGAASADDVVALMGALSRMYVADRLPLPALEDALGQVLNARTCADLDAIAERARVSDLLASDRCVAPPLS
jgi:hypothetical protein